MKKALLIISGAMLIMCSPKEAQVEEDRSPQPQESFLTPEQMKAISLKVSSPEKRTISNTVRTTGYIHLPPGNMASVSALMAGYVKSVRVLEGVKARKGQVLATLENPEYLDLQEQYLQAKSRLKYLKAEWDRQKLLSEDNINARKNLLLAEADYRDMEARYNVSREKLKMLGIDLRALEQGDIASTINIVSPIDGFVSMVDVSLGQYVEPAQVLFGVVDDSHMHLALKVYEHDIVKVREGQKVLFKAPGLDDKTYEGEVFLVGRTLEGESRTAHVHAHIKNEEKCSFVANMYVDAAIAIDEKEELALPDQAVVGSGNKRFVFLKSVEDDSGCYFRKVEIDAGASNEGFTAVGFRERLDSTAQFVTEGAFYLQGLESR